MSAATGLYPERELYLAPEALAQIADAVCERLRREQLIEKPLTPAQVAALIGRSAQYVQDLCRDKELRALPGKPYLIPPAELRRWMREAR